MTVINRGSVFFCVAISFVADWWNDRSPPATPVHGHRGVRKAKAATKSKVTAEPKPITPGSSKASAGLADCRHFSDLITQTDLNLDPSAPQEISRATPTMVFVTRGTLFLELICIGCSYYD